MAAPEPGAEFKQFLLGMVALVAGVIVFLWAMGALP